MVKIRYLTMFVVLFLFIAVSLKAQQLSYAEYFFDNDPGFGNGTSVSITAGDSIDLNLNLNVSSLSIGFHTLYLRTKTSNGRWSFAEGRMIFVQNSTFGTSSYITESEYFFDIDPGFGMATSISIGAGDSLDYSGAINTNGLSSGFHTCYIRVKNANGKWSITESRTIYIGSSSTAALSDLVQLEYFFDDDPGFGNGTQISVTAADTIDFSGSLSTSALSAGFHTLYVRTKNGNGIWGIAESRGIFIQSPTTGSNSYLTQAEYFFDNDPGFGAGTQVSVTAADSLDISQAISSTSLSSGFHTLYFRVKNSLGRWSIAETRAVYIQSVATGSASYLTQAEYFFDSDPGFGGGTPIVFTSGDSLDVTKIVSSSSLNKGFHNLYLRVKNASGAWSLTSDRVAYIQMDTTNAKIVAIEYYVDTEPGIGNATKVSTTPADSIDQLFSFNHTIPDTLTHKLVSRVKNAYGSWSFPYETQFKVQPCTIPNVDFSFSDVCYGQSVMLKNISSGTDSLTTYKWDISNDGTVDYTSKDSIYLNFANPGNYQIQLRVINFVCYDTIIKTIHVYPKPTVNITHAGVSSICQGQNLVLMANTGPGTYSYSWSKNNVELSGSYSYFQANQAGAYKVKVTNQYGCIDSSSAKNVTVYSLPTATTTPTGIINVCQGDSINFAAPTGSGLSYVWKKYGSFIPYATSANYTAQQSGYYSVEITDQHGCKNESAIAEFNVNPMPNSVISTSGSTTVCEGNSLVLNANTASGFTYKWLKNTDTISGATLSNLSVTETANYAAVIKTAQGCVQKSNVISATVNPNPIVNLTALGSTNFCQGDSVKLKTPFANGNSYQWSINNQQISGATDTIYKAIQSGSYVVKVTNSYNCAVTSSPISVVVNPMPSAYIINSSALTFCQGDSVVLDANLGAGLSYQWFEGGNLISGKTNPQLVAYQSGTYSVKVTNSYNCSEISSPIVVNVIPTPTSVFTLQSDVCSGDTIAITYTGTGNSGALFNWNFQSGNIISGAGIGPYQVSFAGNSGKVVSLKVVQNGCSSLVFSDTIQVHQVQAVASTVGAASVCDYDSVVLFVNSGANMNHQWFKDGILLNGKTNPILTVNQGGNYFVVTTDLSINCQQKSNIIPVQINSSDFNLAFTATPTTLTAAPFNVSINNQTPNYTNYFFDWNFGDGSTSSYFNPSHNYQFNGNYTVRLVAENAITSCKDTLIKSNYIQCSGGITNPCVVTASIVSSGMSLICEGDSSLLVANSGTGYTYQWTRNNQMIPGANSQQFYAKLSGSYRVIVSDAICSMVSNPFVLSHYPSIIPTISSIGTLLPCTNDSIKLLVNGVFNNYLWSNGATTASTWVNQTGYYSVSITNNYGCVVASAPFTVSASSLIPPSICLVGVDSATNHNLVIWERQPTALIDSFYIYRESTIAGVYTKIGATSYNSSGLFIDQNSNPAQRSYRYKLAAKDTCGQLTLLSDFHKTIHLTISAGMGGSWNLIWDGYQGFTFGSYRIYRGTNANNITLLTQIPSNISSYTDLNPPSGAVYYQIEVVKSSGCYPDSTFAKVNTNYNSSRSNTANNTMAVPPEMQADFSADHTWGYFPTVVKFTDESIGFPTSWTWDFGDGQSSTLQNPSHTYSSQGVYTVSLSVTNQFGTKSITKNNFIFITTTGMDDFSDALQFELFPNPSDGNVNLFLNSITSEDYSMEVYNSLGQMIRRLELGKIQGELKTQMDVKNLVPGVYLIQISGNDFRKVKRLIIQ